MEVRFCKIIGLCLFVIGCQSSDTSVSCTDNKVQKEVTDTMSNTTHYAIDKKQQYNLMPLDSIYIEDYKVITTKKKMMLTWGKPDSISQLVGECGYLEGEKIIEYHYKGLQLFTYGEMASLDQIDLDACDKTIRLGQVFLNRNTKILDLKTIFNDSYECYIASHNDQANYEALILYSNQNRDHRITLVFEDGRLHDLIIWSPC